MKRKNIFFTLLEMLFSKNFYHFIALKTYTGFHRFLFMKQLRTQYPDTIIADDIIIPNPDHVRIGEKCIIDPGCNFNCGYSPHLGNINLGRQVIIGYNTTLYAGAGKITIENNVDLGINSILTTQTRSMKQNPVQDPVNFEHVYGEIFIGEGTMVASNVTILSGTTLGKYCNIVAGSVVQGNYPDNTTLAGNPARPLPRIKFN
jgi:acetyltransferase-like isoleucine patch superfamily enzyme